MSGLSPNWAFGYVPPPSEWSSLWSGKQDSIPTMVAAAGTTQGTATVLTAQFNIVTTVAPGTGVKAPLGYCKIWNAGANDMLMYPVSSAQFDTLGANIPILVPVGGSVETYFSGTQGYAR